MTTQRQNIKNEQFFTNLETAERLCEIVKSQPWFSRKNITRIIEPSAGDGAFLGFINVDLAYDIEPKHPDVVGQDFLNDPTFILKPMELIELKSYLKV